VRLLPGAAPCLDILNCVVSRSCTP
jgi:hypothetical protein